MSERAHDYVDRWMSEKPPEEQAAIRKSNDDWLEANAEPDE